MQCRRESEREIDLRRVVAGHVGGNDTGERGSNHRVSEPGGTSDMHADRHRRGDGAAAKIDRERGSRAFA